MARTPQACPIRLVAVHLLSAAGEISRILWLDAEGHLSSQPHWLPREQALVMASNQQLVMGSSAEVRVL
ncbi:hypothetical protein [Synechococcus sp. GFB01]|uniref:hypothetical protein n=1 Tax=Synechococcus sp. GFB01 TaxID=1662190 RepID=UPI00064EBEB6|nr:hypothetical protein [Synechococcus sp. GFB01]KMM17853.1 hypothetical protein SYNGFB01_01145 [Synechococcus sp. GFB01]